MERRRGRTRSIDFPCWETREKTVFPCITVFLYEYDIQRERGAGRGGDRLFFNFPFVCLSTLQIRATITTSCCSRWLSIAELSSVKSDRVARFFAFCFLISSCAAPATRVLSIKRAGRRFFFSGERGRGRGGGLFSSVVSVIITTSCKFIYSRSYAELYSTRCHATLLLIIALYFMCLYFCAYASDALSRKGVLLTSYLTDFRIDFFFHL